MLSTWKVASPLILCSKGVCFLSNALWFVPNPGCRPFSAVGDPLVPCSLSLVLWLLQPVVEEAPCLRTLSLLVMFSIRYGIDGWCALLVLGWPLWLSRLTYVLTAVEPWSP